MFGSWVAFALSLFLLGCTNGGKDKSATNGTGAVAAKGEFPYVEVPLYITNRAEALCYSIDKFWNPYLFKASRDTSLYSIDTKTFEKAYAQYIELLQVLENNYGSFEGDDARRAANVVANSHKKIFEAADSLYLAGHKKLLMRLIEMSERYLYNPNSPFLNEELYIPVVDAVLELRSIDSLHKMQHVYQKNMVMLNRKGTVASNFDYEYLLPDRRPAYSSLHKTDAEYLLIYFNNPGCASCKEIEAILSNNQTVAYMLEEGRLKVISMYIDKDIKSWEERFAMAPRNWIYARDYMNQFEANELYGIRAIPSMYLLGKGKEVILKDAPAERIVEYFGNQ